MYASLLALAASLSLVSAQTARGFNYGAVTSDGASKDEAAFTAEFNAARGLPNTDGAFSSARLYTMIQSGTQNTPISAIPAAISTDTRLLLGIWASAGQQIINDEIAALTSAIQTYGEAFTSRVNAISVGSEDLYRISPTGLRNDPSGIGAQPSQLVSYIGQVRAALANTPLRDTPIGHVETFEGWRNGSNADVIAASDFLGMNTFPYFQTLEDNSIENAPRLFNEAYDITVAAANGKPVIVTETGWPVGGADSARAEPSTENARAYYEAVGCNTLFGRVDTYWYTLVDANPNRSGQPQFGVVGTSVATTPLFDLSCSARNTTSSSPSSPGSGTPTPPAPGTTQPGNSTGTPLAPEGGRPGSTGGVQPGSNSTVPTGVYPTGTAPSPTGTGVQATGAASQMKTSNVVGFFGAVAAFVAFA